MTETKTPAAKPRPVYYDGDIIERDMLRFRINIEDDSDHDEPWNDGDGNGIVSDWETRDKRPGERVLCTDRSSKRFYDWQGTIAQAKQEGWGLCDEERAKLAAKLGREPKPGDITAEAVRRDFERMRRWCNDDWRYVGVVVTLIPEGEDDDYETDYCHAIWGMESDDDAGIAMYAEEFMDGIIAEHAKELEEAEESRRADELAEMERVQVQEKEREELTQIAGGIAEYIREAKAACGDSPVPLVDDLTRLCKAAGVDLTESTQITKGE